MVLPVIPIAIAAAAGAGGGVLGSLFGGGKKDQTEIAHQHTYTEGARSLTYQPQYAPVISYAYQGPTTITESPGASSKKEMSLEQESRPEAVSRITAPTEVTPSVTQGMAEGTNMLYIAAIAAVGVVAYGYFTGGKKKR